ncbi:MAG: O-antigen ligase family protein [Acidobacteriota bacterium]
MTSLLRRLQSAVPSGSSPGYWLFAGHVVTVFGIALSNALMGLMAVWALVHRRSIDWRFRPYAVLFLPVSLYSIFFVVSAVTSLDRSVSVSGLRDLLSFATLFLAPFLVRGEDEVRRVLDGILAMTCGVALIGIGQYFLTGAGGLHHRIVGPFSHYQTFAGILLIGALVAVARLASGDGWRRPITWLALGILLWTLLLTLTRGAWVAVAVALGVMVLLRARWTVAGGIALVVLCAVLLGPASWAERVQSIVDLSDQSNYDRLCMLDAGLFMIDERPLFGIGLEMVEERYPIYPPPRRWLLSRRRARANASLGRGGGGRGLRVDSREGLEVGGVRGERERLGQGVAGLSVSRRNYLGTSRS